MNGMDMRLNDRGECLVDKFEQEINFYGDS